MNVLRGISDVESFPEVFSLLRQNQPEESLSMAGIAL